MKWTVNCELGNLIYTPFAMDNSCRSSSSLTRQCIWLTFTRPGYPFGKLRGGYKKAQKLEPNRTNKAWEINHSRGLSELMPIPNRYTWHNITDESWSGREINERTDYPNDFWWTLHSRRWSFFFHLQPSKASFLSSNKNIEMVIRSHKNLTFIVLSVHHIMMPRCTPWYANQIELNRLLW